MLRRPLALIVAAVAVLGALALVLTFAPSDHYIVLPDRIRATDPLVSIPGEDAALTEQGIYMVDVRIGRASLFERIFPGIREGATLVPERAINPEGVSDRQRRSSSLNAMSRSQQIAVAVALRELGREVEVASAGAEVVLVQPGSPAEGRLEVGDVIVHADGDEIVTTGDLRRAMDDVEPGGTVELVVEREEGRRTELSVETRESETEPGRAVVGVQVQDAAEFDFPVDIEIDAGGIGGPSAGLAFALDIVDELGDDVDLGRRVVATGELTLDGEVLPIGGVKQKTIAARQGGADVFLVPDRNAEEARKSADGLEIVPVSTFAEALAVLATR